MGKSSAKNKIVILVAAWVLASASMFLYFFKFLDYSNQQTLSSLAGQRQSLTVLEQEKQGYTKAQDDLTQLSQQFYQPDMFFSRDINFANEIQTLDDWSQKLGVNMQLSGISGTVQTASKAPTLSPLVIIPYSISLSGSFTQVLEFIEALENLGFITNVSGISVSASSQTNVNVNLSASFYLAN